MTNLQSILRARALLDAILCPEWDSRYHFFDSDWSDHEQLGSMRNGEGDHFFALFNDSGCFLKGFDHESQMSPWASDDGGLWPGLLEGVPACFSECLTEPAFDIQATTFCIWRQHTDDEWSRSDIEFPDREDPDGSEYLLSHLDGNPESYSKWAQEYFEVDINHDAVAEIMSGNALTWTLVESLNPNQSRDLLKDDLGSIGWPVEA